jgi:signal transduction histidine kinase
VDLAALSASVVEQLEPVAQAQDITLGCRVSGEVPVTGDAGWLERLLLNLLDNAIKFTPARGRISVRVSRESGSAQLEVRDTGIGISPGAIPHLFERFYRAGSARSPHAEPRRPRPGPGQMDRGSARCDHPCRKPAR